MRYYIKPPGVEAPKVGGRDMSATNCCRAVEVRYSFATRAEPTRDGGEKLMRQRTPAK